MRTKPYAYALALLIGLTFHVACFAQHNNHQQATVATCDSLLSANLLNSERIAKKFGGYGLDVLYNTDKLRVSNLYDGQKITRTLAIVNYPATIDSAFAKEHRAIVKGGSIGATFKAAGWKVIKKNIYLGEITPSANYKKLYAIMGNIQPTKLSIWTYVFRIQKDGKEYPYVTISEVYHPQYLSLADLKCINKDADVYLKKTPAVTQELKNVTKLMTLDFKGLPTK